jgi:hypothetical protein
MQLFRVAGEGVETLSGANRTILAFRAQLHHHLRTFTHEADGALSSFTRCLPETLPA